MIINLPVSQIYFQNEAVKTSYFIVKDYAAHVSFLTKIRRGMLNVNDDDGSSEASE